MAKSGNNGANICCTMGLAIAFEFWAVVSTFFTALLLAQTKRFSTFDDEAVVSATAMGFAVPAILLAYLVDNTHNRVNVCRRTIEVAVILALALALTATAAWALEKEDAIPITLISLPTGLGLTAAVSTGCSVLWDECCGSGGHNMQATPVPHV